MIIALDGPSGVGKGTLGCALATYYHLAFLDTGLLYRRSALWMLRHGKDPSKESDSLEGVKHFQEISAEDSFLRTEEVGKAASQFAVHLPVRHALLEYQRNFAHHPPPSYHGAILDGRDIGTVILPDAPYKIYLTAHIEVRAERRFHELQMQGFLTTFHQVLEEVKARDRRDQSRKNCPLYPASDAFILDTSLLSREEVLAEVISYIEKRK